MAEIFLDITKKRLLVALFSRECFPKVEILDFPEVLGDIFQDEVATQVIRGIDKLRVASPEKIKGVWLCLGVRELYIQKMKQLKMFSAKAKRRVKADYLQKLRLGMINRIFKEGLYYITEEFSKLDLDGVFYPNLPSDKCLSCHSVAIESFVVGIERKKLEFFKRIIKQAHSKIRGLVCRELMMSKIVFSDSERLKGALFIYVGMKSTVLSFYEKGRLYVFKWLPIGEQDLTLAIMEEFGLPFWVAEKLKYSYMDIDLVAGREPIIRIEGPNRIYEIEARELCDVFYKAISKLFETVRVQIYSWDVSLDGINCSIMGEICLIDGVLEIAERILGFPVKMAYCKNQSCVNLPAAFSTYSVLVGAFWQWFEQGAYNRNWREKVKLWLQDIWEFF